MCKTLEERNLAIIETVMNELGVSDIEELPAKVIELKESAQHGVYWTGFTVRQIEQIEIIASNVFEKLSKNARQ